METLYADASALVKLVLEEVESPALHARVAEHRIVSCSLARLEVPRAIRRAAQPDAARQLRVAAVLLDDLPLLPVDSDLLDEGGRLEDPALRSLDAIHVCAALQVADLDAFVSYDRRQAAVVRSAGLTVESPGW